MKNNLLLLFLLACLTLSAQEETEEAILQEVLQNASPAQVQSQLLILQSGQGNQIRINSSPNQSTEIFQNGDAQQVVIEMQGDQNQVKAVQEGLENDYQLYLEGVNNQTQIIQQGVSNTVIQELRGVETLEVELIQIGAGHELIQLQQGGRSLPLKVIQQGSPTIIIIEKIE